MSRRRPAQKTLSEAKSCFRAEILETAQGTTIQFAVDATLVRACYENPELLIWRDAGALAATICLVAAALDLTATPVGRIGDIIVKAAGMPDGFVGAGAVHIGTQFKRPETKHHNDVEARDFS